ncbi:MAG: DUF3256 family protein, partial [Ruminococcus flavefaciens]|nr:DUF3256 family protein [Ruminococcus flavefaciens]
MKAMKLGKKIGAIAAVFLTVTALCTSGVTAGSKSAAVYAAIDTIPLAQQAFVKMDVQVLDLLDHTTRENMLDYFAADSVWQAPNEMGGLSRLDTVTNDYLKVKLTDVSTLQIKVLPMAKGDYTVMTIYTIGSENETPDSEIRFFDSGMHPLETKKMLKLPGLDEFFSIPKGCTTNMKEIRGLIPFPTVEYDAGPSTDTLTGKLTVGNYIS